jgi:hypothetical protein
VIIVGFEAKTCDEQYELYDRCAVCCLPGVQWGYEVLKRFICLECSQAGTGLPIPTGEWFGECSIDDVAIRRLEGQKLFRIKK